jgi:hypothetical protein
MTSLATQCAEETATLVALTPNTKFATRFDAVDKRFDKLEQRFMGKFNSLTNTLDHFLKRLRIRKRNSFS